MLTYECGRTRHIPRIWPRVLALYVVFAPAGIAEAATTTNTFTVQIAITASCAIDSASTLNFGGPGGLTAHGGSTSTVQVQCTNTAPYNIALDAASAPTQSALASDVYADTVVVTVTY